MTKLANPWKNIVEPSRVGYDGNHPSKTKITDWQNEPSAVFQIDADDSGFLPPRLTSAQRDAIIQPAKGLMIFNTTTGLNEVYNGSSWGPVGGVVQGSVTLSDATPAPLGTAAAGASANVARGDHVHALPTAAQVGAAPASHTHTASDITYLTGTLLWDVAATNGYVVSPDITVTGAKLGDFVSVAAPYDLQGMLCTAYVKSADTVKIVLFNPSGNQINVSSATWKVRVG